MNKKQWIVKEVKDGFELDRIFNDDPIGKKAAFYWASLIGAPEPTLDDVVLEDEATL